ncbi:acyl-CoA carboxylase subunit beta [Thalassomonas haliotis]|uniref:Acyl-CoA carboxylase subunit beta n=1 Tax=Thalassomonas haliotis TaxID=485448 RepID=A0ABY7V888_9GAMM|nr:carboxyl transferase domain-containing protein [Thalassomonas haliotis]WDE09874.1 acyl-CoA carboxylase subunit beta [Thalassomonas haliotis]
MTKLNSYINPQGQDYQANREQMLAQLQQVRDIEQFCITTEQEKQGRYHKKNMLLPRERLQHLVDAGAPFIELSSLAGYKMDDDKDGSGAGGGCIAGIGYVSGVRCLVKVDNYAVKGGTVSVSGMEKNLRLQQIAIENKLPFITLAQSGGANLAYATKIFAPGGRSFANQARMSALGIPQVTVVHGSATAGGAYQPGLSDYVIMVKNQASMYLAGPPLLKAATGEIASEEALGGAQMHIKEPGSGEYLADNDRDAIALARDILAMTGNTFNQEQTQANAAYPKPVYPAEELLGIIPAQTKTPYDAREIIARVADGSAYLEFKADWDQQTLCGHIKLGGLPCGVIANNGPITAKGASKAAQFIQLCQQSQVPLLFLHNTTGFMVGTESEQSGIIKHGSKMIQAVANASVPKISIVIGGSYGAGNYAMCGRGFDPRFIFAWPNSKTSVMGGAQAGKVLRIVTEAKMKAAGAVDTEKLAQLEQGTCAMIEQGAGAIPCSARLWDDGIIDPRHTRALLIELFALCRQADQQDLAQNHFGVARF